MEVIKKMKTMKNILLYTAAAFLLFFSACSEMDDNYEDYLTNRVYSPKVTNLRAENGLQTCTLRWDNPEGDLAKSIEIRYDEEVITFDTMVDSAIINELEIKGYTMQVFTIDAFGNNSVPAETYVFPNGE